MSRSSARAARARAAQTVTLTKSPTTAVRVSLSEWRGVRSVELSECETRGLAGLYYATGAKVTLPLGQLPELIDALRSLEVEARRLNLLEAHHEE
jgi:hypothetical protein